MRIWLPRWPIGRVPVGQWLGGKAASLPSLLLAERGQWVLWLPPSFGAGIAAYFALTGEPPLWPAIAASLLAMIGAALMRGQLAWRALMLALCLAGAGFANAKWRADRLAAPVLDREIGPLVVEGRVVDIEPYRANFRVVLDRLDRGRWPRGVPFPAQIRVSMPEAADVKVGDRIQTRATLLPPMEPVAPGAYDFQRDAWFMRLGAVGFARAPPQIVARDQESGLWWAIGRLRGEITERLLQASGDNRDRGAMGAALLTGEQNGIGAETMQDMRDSGLAHLLSISGLHLAMVAAILMGAVRLVLVLIPAVALRYPIKKWAAAVALAGTAFYLLLAGAPVPAQRSFVMAAIVLLAVLVDRNALSMRGVPWAAMAVLLLAPESLLGASFQMSFSAVIALIAVWDGTRNWRRARAAQLLQRSRGWFWLSFNYVAGVVLTSLVASLATAPFALYHFNRVAWFGILANLLAVPITGFWVMPLGMLALLLMPLGLEDWPLQAMGWGIDAIIWIAHTVASWPSAASLVPAMPVSALVAIACGMLWLCLWQARWRWLGLAPIAAAVAIALLSRGPDILIAADGHMFAIRDDSGKLLVLPKGGKLLSESWTRRAGQDGIVLLPSRGASGDGAIGCDRNGCSLRRDGQRISVVRSADAAAEDCATATLIVGAVAVPKTCKARTQVIDRADLRRLGALAIWIEGGEVRIVSDREWRGQRPWVPRLVAQPRE